MRNLVWNHPMTALASGSGVSVRVTAPSNEMLLCVLPDRI
jgi:hypothetical protein